MPGILITTTVPIDVYQRLEVEAQEQRVSLRNLLRSKLGAPSAKIGRPQITASDRMTTLLEEYRSLLDRIAHLRTQGSSTTKPEAKAKNIRAKLEFAGLVDSKGRIVDFRFAKGSKS